MTITNTDLWKSQLQISFINTFSPCKSEFGKTNSGVYSKLTLRPEASKKKNPRNKKAIFQDGLKMRLSPSLTAPFFALRVRVSSTGRDASRRGEGAFGTRYSLSLEGVTNTRATLTKCPLHYPAKFRHSSSQTLVIFNSITQLSLGLE